MILKLLLNGRIIWMIVIKILMNTIGEKNKILIVCHDIIADMLKDKNVLLIVTELFIRGTKLNIVLVFVIKS